MTSPGKYLHAKKDSFNIKADLLQGQDIKATNLEVYGTTTLYGDAHVSANPPYDSTPEAIVLNSNSSSGTSTYYARGDHSHGITMANFVTGSSNQITVTNNANGTITLSFPTTIQTTTVNATNLLPITDNTGVVGNSSYT